MPAFLTLAIATRTKDGVTATTGCARVKTCDSEAIAVGELRLELLKDYPASEGWRVEGPDDAQRISDADIRRLARAIGMIDPPVAHPTCGHPEAPVCCHYSHDKAIVWCADCCPGAPGGAVPAVQPSP